jgi:hypothetical protein
MQAEKQVYRVHNIYGENTSHKIRCDGQPVPGQFERYISEELKKFIENEEITSIQSVNFYGEGVSLVCTIVYTAYIMEGVK